MNGLCTDCRVTVSYHTVVGGVKVLGGVHFQIHLASLSRSRSEMRSARGGSQSARGGHVLPGFALFCLCITKNSSCKCPTRKC